MKIFNENIKPLLNKYCVDCHGEKKSKGKVRFDNIDPNIINGQDSHKWEDARDVFNTGEMPPEDEKQPTVAEREIITMWLDSEFKKARLYGNPDKTGQVRRLTRYELQYSLEDLFKFSARKIVKVLPDESSSSETGLKNNSKLLVVSGPHIESYFKVIFNITEKLREIVELKPYTINLDINSLEIDKKEEIRKENRYKENTGKPSFLEVERSGNGLVIKPGGHITMKIPRIPKHLFRASIEGRTDKPGSINFAFGYKYPGGKKEKSGNLGDFSVDAGKSLSIFSFDSSMGLLPDEITRSIDRNYFIRLRNNSASNFYLSSLDFIGDLNTQVSSAIFPFSKGDQDQSIYIKNNISSFIRKAFRRPASETELLKYFNVYQKHAEVEAEMPALISTFEEILCSPSFFYIGMPGEMGPEQKENFRLAEKLSYFLWCSLPDEKLLKDAETGILSHPEILKKHVQRMLKDEKSIRFVEQFTDQWLHTSNLFNVAVDRSYYRDFDVSFKAFMHRETIESINDVFRNGSSALNLLKSDYVFVNEVLADYYNISGVKGMQIRKVKIDERDNRGGLLTQGTFLVGNSDGANSHAILRGVWLMETILNDPPPEAPNNVPPFDETIPGFDKMTLNQKMIAHRNNDACLSCHKKIDPWGITFENYDASGAWRDKVLFISVKGKNKITKSFLPIEREAVLPSKHTIDGMRDLKNYLIKYRKNDFAGGLCEKLLSYALSRNVTMYDEELIKDLSDNLIESDFSVPSLISAIVVSENFLKGEQ